MPYVDLPSIKVFPSIPHIFGNLVLFCFTDPSEDKSQLVTVFDALVFETGIQSHNSVFDRQDWKYWGSKSYTLAMNHIPQLVSMRVGSQLLKGECFAIYFAHRYTQGIGSTAAGVPSCHYTQ
eukprot:TRINITY_DN17458_c1_g1_i8.p2 TRINITY_DN17458_c1_g1~~TRINITY_DN17458_c1_g1_i8.p2  ORF type:complete len:122 (-),score=10.42 TRINITY_DN17458_c1_g1_i8:58-423(-)